MGKGKLDPMSEAALEMVKSEKMEVENRKKEQELKEKGIAFTGEMIGTIKAMNFIRSLSDITVLMKLKELKESKRYKDAGMTWEQTCEAMGLSRRAVDEKLSALEPFRDDFLGNFASFFSRDFKKIKYLGNAVSGEFAGIEGNAITFKGETIPVDAEHAEDIQALLEKLEADHKAQLEEKESDLKAQKRMAASKEDVIKKMEREIKRLEKTVDMTDLTPEEQEQINILSECQKQLITMVQTIHKNIDFNASPEVVLRTLYFLYIFGSKLFLDERMILNEIYKDAEHCPWEILEEELPTTDVMLDNLPLSRGTGLGDAYKAKVSEREAKTAAKKDGKGRK
jgi:hypothetical protein